MMYLKLVRQLEHLEIATAMMEAPTVSLEQLATKD